ncbi:hydroxymethylbilane synthase [bacterium]|nr:hydroxymethylbilane synthase [bacterium]
MQTLRIGTRASRLAMCQAQWVKDRLIRAGLTDKVELVPIKTKGDKILDSPLAKIGGKGLFVKEIEEALIRNEIDLAVHSMKDVPAQLIDGLCIGAVTVREDPRDVLISKNNNILRHLSPNAVIGTSSLRRQSQILHSFPGFHIVQIRGNLETRIRRVQGDDLDAVIVAAAGIHRMGLQDQVTEYLNIDISLPAIGQGALGIEIRIGDTFIEKIVQTMDHPETHMEVTAERAFLARLEGGCQVPIAALSKIQGTDDLTLAGMVASLDGVKMIRDKISSHPNRAYEAGIDLAERLLQRGADKILNEIIAKGKIK